MLTWCGGRWGEGGEGNESTDTRLLYGGRRVLPKMLMDVECDHFGGELPFHEPFSSFSVALRE